MLQGNALFTSWHAPRYPSTLTATLSQHRTGLVLESMQYEICDRLLESERWRPLSRALLRSPTRAAHHELIAHIHGRAVFSIPLFELGGRLTPRTPTPAVLVRGAPPSSSEKREQELESWVPTQHKRGWTEVVLSSFQLHRPCSFTASGKGELRLFHPPSYHHHHHHHRCATDF